MASAAALADGRLRCPAARRASRAGATGYRGFHFRESPPVSAPVSAPGPESGLDWPALDEPAALVKAPVAELSKLVRGASGPPVVPVPVPAVPAIAETAPVTGARALLPNG